MNIIVHFLPQRLFLLEMPLNYTVALKKLSKSTLTAGTCRLSGLYCIQCRLGGPFYLVEPYTPHRATHMCANKIGFTNLSNPCKANWAGTGACTTKAVSIPIWILIHLLSHTLHPQKPPFPVGLPCSLIPCAGQPGSVQSILSAQLWGWIQQK